ncbi:MAG: hypothetical protein WC960_02875 [Bacteroidales bacterium]
MKRVKKYIFLLPLILLFACQKEELSREDNREEGFTIKLLGSSDGNKTKTSFGVPGEEVVNFLWKSGDNLGVYVENSGNIPSWGNNIVSVINREASQGAGHKIGSFSLKLTSITPSSQYSLKIYYPHYQFAGDDASTISHRIFSLQTQSVGSNSEHIGLSGDFGYATASFTTPSDLSQFAPEIYFTLEHKSSYLWFDITSEDEASYNNWIIKQISVTAPEGYYLSGATKYNSQDDTYAIDESSTQKHNFVSLNIPGGIPISSATPATAYMVVAPTQLAGKEIEIKYLLESKDGSQTKNIIHNRTISATSQAFKSGTTHIFNEVLPNSEGSGWSFVDNSVAIALDHFATANSYIVSTPGNYSFDATVIGNGEAGLLGLPTSTTQFHTDNPAISPTSVELVWQSAPSLIADLSLSDGRVYFTKGDETKGNALIAVKDSGGDILWSWHIWCTDVGEPQTYINDVGYSFEVMDRNLGATIGLDRVPTTSQEEIASIGLSYQFGRKDPFIGINALSTTATLSTTYDIDGNIYGWPATELTSPAVGTIENSIQNPTLFISSEAKTPYDWFVGKGSGGGIDVRGFYLWGNPYGFWHGTEGGSSPNNPRTPQKSIYDPCPVGWMVAPRNTFTGVTASNSTGVAGKGRLLYYQSATTSGAATWYPFSGRYNNTGLLATQGGTSWIWTSSFRHQTTYAATLFSMTSTAVATTNNYYAVWGASVRCVQQY